MNIGLLIMSLILSLTITFIVKKIWGIISVKIISNSFTLLLFLTCCVLLYITFSFNQIESNIILNDVDAKTALAKKINNSSQLEEMSHRQDGTYTLNHSQFTLKSDLQSILSVFPADTSAEPDAFQLTETSYFTLLEQLKNLDLGRFYKNKGKIIFVQGGWIDSEYGLIYVPQSVEEPRIGDYINGNSIKDLEKVNDQWYSFSAD